METLGKIFGSPARLKIIRLFLFNKDAAFTVDEVTDRTRLTKEVARKELADLLSSSFLKKKRERAPVRYNVNTKFEHFAALDTFVRETTNIPPAAMLTTLKKAGTLRLVVLSGFFTGIPEPQADLLVVGDNLEERSLAKAVHTLEAELGREIRYAFFPTSDFRYRLGVYDRLLRDIFDYPHRLLLDKIGL